MGNLHGQAGLSPDGEIEHDAGDPHAIPKRKTSQNHPFSPPLTFPEWGRGPLPNMPPMVLNHVRSTFLGILERTQIRNSNKIPISRSGPQ